ncbi:hypothetical protein K3148_06515 [Qipengyuania aurantiaca]|uniref:Uncharacterized protein n=1 Tax=Qipengyuania aurantiaca TaxID=2867233 RepID=A0ABX8ZQ18_9SPHN|nr:hypothetical protein [Qipengyuania aurantiaca]QZD91032.1 hypothetical protein K3148_06515 [Qipengyuania aurantiaca]
MPIIDHFRRVGHIHALWLISILIGIICAFVVKLPSANVVTSYMTFAATVASLLLAVVAIFYSIVSNQSISANLGALDFSASQMEQASVDLHNITDQLDAKFEKVFDEFKFISPAVKGISERLNDFSTASAANGEVGVDEIADGKPDIIKTFSSTVNGGRAAFYALAQSALTGRSFHPEQMVGDRLIFADFISGYAQALRAVNCKDLNVSVEERDGKYFFSGEMPSDIAQRIIRDFGMEEGDAIRNLIDQYFYGAARSPDDGV